MRRFYARYGKRIWDVTLSGLAIVVLSPLLLAVSIWIKLDSAGPVFFRQKRVGKDNRIFRIYKFRTMRNDAPHDTPTHLLNNPKKYITRSGRFLRKTSLDELPQLFNIFLGQMSVVGPRPALWNQDDLVAEREKYGANGLAPGLTGLAQISGRDELKISEKAKLDGEYAHRLGFAMDCRCLFGTVVKVLRNDGVVEGVAEKGDNASSHQ
ncbi:MAG: sugar transferase [Eubacteriales bacterium]|nr:sugar transferase [Eubacteriales bacterium]